MIGEYLSKGSLTKHTCSWRDKYFMSSFFVLFLGGRYVVSLFAWNIYFIRQFYISLFWNFGIANFYFNLTVILNRIQGINVIAVKTSQFVNEIWIV